MSSNSTLFGNRVNSNNSGGGNNSNSNNNNNNNNNNSKVIIKDIKEITTSSATAKSELEICAVCKSKNVQICTGCLLVYYCGTEHQNQDWPNHKNFCSGLNRRNDLLDRAERSKDIRKKFQSEVFTSGSLLNKDNSTSNKGKSLGSTTSPPNASGSKFFNNSTVNNNNINSNNSNNGSSLPSSPNSTSPNTSPPTSTFSPNTTTLNSSNNNSSSSNSNTTSQLPNYRKSVAFTGSIKTAPNQSTQPSSVASATPRQIVANSSAKPSPVPSPMISKKSSILSNNNSSNSNNGNIIKPAFAKQQQQPTQNSNNNDNSSIKALQQQLQDSLKNKSNSPSPSPSNTLNSSTSSTNSIISNSSPTAVDNQSSPSQQQQTTPPPPAVNRFANKSNLNIIPQPVFKQSPVISTYKNNENNTTSNNLDSNNESDSNNNSSLLVDTSTPEQDEEKENMKNIKNKLSQINFGAPPSFFKKPQQQVQATVIEEDNSNNNIDNDSFDFNNNNLYNDNNNNNIYNQQSPPPRKRSTGSTGSAGSAGSNNNKNHHFIREHKKNQSLPDQFYDYYQNNKNINNGYKNLNENENTGGFDDINEDAYYGEDNEDDEDTSKLGKGRSRPKGLRTNNSAVFEWESGTIEYKQNSTQPKKLGFGVGSRGGNSFSKDSNNTQSYDEDASTAILTTNNNSIGNSNSQSSEDLNSQQQPQQQQQQQSTTERVAGKFRMIGGDIKKKAGIIGTLTKNKVSEVANKTKGVSKSNNEDTNVNNSNNNNNNNNNEQLPISEDTIIFGLPLEESIRRSARLHPLVPDIVYKSIEYIREKGIQEEGIFRLSGSASAITSLKNEFDRGYDVDLNTQLDQHVVAGILKLFLRQIPETLFTQQFCDELEELRIGGNTADAINKRIIGCTQLLRDLPEANRCILHHLCSLLNQISFEPTTKMSTVNLSIVFAPTLGCSLEVMTCLIAYYDEIFSVQTYNYNQ